MDCRPIANDLSVMVLNVLFYFIYCNYCKSNSSELLINIVLPLPYIHTYIHTYCDDVDNMLDNTCEVIRQETVLFSTPETDYIIYD